MIMRLWRFTISPNKNSRALPLSIFFDILKHQRCEINIHEYSLWLLRTKASKRQRREILNLNTRPYFIPKHPWRLSLIKWSHILYSVFSPSTNGAKSTPMSIAHGYCTLSLISAKGAKSLTSTPAHILSPNILGAFL